MEIEILLRTEDIDVLFLTETDVHLNSVDDFAIKGYNTVLQKRKTTQEKVRIVALIKDDKSNQMRIKENLMANKN